ncbi:hypothetical protein KAJ77_12205, partial [bacterium]|nr:hypothetical protein [bacterium]
MTRSKHLKFLITVVGLLLVLAIPGIGFAGIHDWSPEEVRSLKSLWIESLPPVPTDHSNAYGDD